MDLHPLDESLLAVLEQAGAQGELTPGSLRTRLAKKMGGTAPPTVELQRRIHALWKEGRLTVEPPTPGRREIRLWPGKASSGATTPLPSRPCTEALLQICTQLASAYHDSRHSEAKEELARLLFNLGVVRSDPEGTSTDFKGRRHLCCSPVLPGDPVKVTESGWLLRNCPGDHILSKSRVVPA